MIDDKVIRRIFTEDIWNGETRSQVPAPPCHHSLHLVTRVPRKSRALLSRYRKIPTRTDGKADLSPNMRLYHHLRRRNSSAGVSILSGVLISPLVPLFCSSCLTTIQRHRRRRRYLTKTSCDIETMGRKNVVIENDRMNITENFTGESGH